MLEHVLLIRIYEYSLLFLLGPYHFCPFCAQHCMKCSLGISNFLEEISSLSHSIVFLYLFALIAEEGFFFSLNGKFYLFIYFFPFNFISWRLITL